MQIAEDGHINLHGIATFVNSETGTAKYIVASHKGNKQVGVITTRLHLGNHVDAHRCCMHIHTLQGLGHLDPLAATAKFNACLHNAID